MSIVVIMVVISYTIIIVFVIVVIFNTACQYKSDADELLGEKEGGAPMVIKSLACSTLHPTPDAFRLQS